MAPLRFALYLAFLFLGILPLITNLSLSKHVRQDIDFFPANAGENVTLHCNYEGEGKVFYWYKQSPGQTLRLISTFYKYNKHGNLHNEFKNNSRFSLNAEHGENHLTITDLHISDSATYLCARSDSLKTEFVQSKTISVKGSGLNVPALVHQSGSETIQPGGSVNLSCTVHTGTCDGQHSVYWFRNSQESHPGLIYTHGDRSDQCERKPDTQTHTCVYNLTMMGHSHAETDYCAIATCGHILFGNETKSILEQKEDLLALVNFLSGALAFNIILAVSLMYATYTMKNNRNSCQSTARSSRASTPNVEGFQDSDDLHYAALREHTADNRSTRHRDNTQTECVYSVVRQ